MGVGCEFFFVMYTRWLVFLLFGMDGWMDGWMVGMGWGRKDTAFFLFPFLLSGIVVLRVHVYRLGWLRGTDGRTDGREDGMGWEE